jgi:cation diffusion facilitator family transporter
MQWTRAATPQPERRQQYNTAMAVTLAGNVLLAASKGIVAYLSHSVALYADAANSASDVLYSLLLIAGLRIAQQPPDLSHPQGHSRFEPLIGLVVSLSMALAGFEAARASIERFMSGGLAVDPGLPTLVLLASAGVKWGMFTVIRRIATRVNSPALGAAARDNLSDVLTSVAALAGAFGSHYVHPLLDPIGGLLVAAWIFRAAFRAGRENINYLTGAGASPELRKRIADVASAVPGVHEVHHVMTEYAGPSLVIEIHINVDGNISLFQAHDIADAVAEKLEKMPDVDRAYVHIEPLGWR